MGDCGRRGGGHRRNGGNDMADVGDVTGGPRLTCEPDDLVGEYRILASLGSGGSGEVYKAKHVITHRIDAIKFLSCGRPPGEDEEQRWLREIQLQASLQHPNI